MAIRLNLYHEVLRAKREKQYDPVKLSFLGLLVVAIGMAGYYFVQLRSTSVVQSAHAAKKAEFERLSPLAKTAEQREVELKKKIELADRVTQRMEKRFYWAPMFESLVTAVPPSVQITKLSGDVKSGDTSRNCQILLEGLAAGQEPRAAAEELRRAIVEKTGVKHPGVSAVFRNLDDSTERVRLDGNILSTAAFTIQITFKIDGDGSAVEKPTVERTHKPIAQRK